MDGLFEGCVAVVGGDPHVVGTVLATGRGGVEQGGADRGPWQRLQAADVLDDQQLTAVAGRITDVNPADLTRQINAIQMQLLDLAQPKTEALAAARHIDVEALQPSIDRLAKAK
jgi:hypothetical protein